MVAVTPSFGVLLKIVERLLKRQERSRAQADSGEAQLP
jgi:hypothetical protein